MQAIPETNLNKLDQHRGQGVKNNLECKSQKIPLCTKWLELVLYQKNRIKIITLTTIQLFAL